MKHHRLLNLFAANAKRGAFRAEAETNVIELYDFIVSSEEEAAWFGGVSLEGFARALRGMSGTVHLRINSPGGDVFAGVGMAQLMREYKGEIVAHVDGYAASAASVVAIAASRVVMAPASMMMIHKAWTWGIGNADDLLATAELLEKIDGQLAQAYADRSTRSGKECSAEDFMARMAAETWLTPQEAIDCGLADELAQGEKAAANARSRWDVSAFERPPEQARVEDAAAVSASDEEFERDQRLRRARLFALTA